MSDNDPDTAILHDIDDMLSRLRAVGMVRTLPNGTSNEMWGPSAGEAMRITNDRKQAGVLAWSDVLLTRTFLALASESDHKLRGELIRLAAAVTAWVEDIDRKAGE